MHNLIIKDENFYAEITLTIKYKKYHFPFSCCNSDVPKTIDINMKILTNNPKKNEQNEPPFQLEEFHYKINYNIGIPDNYLKGFTDQTKKQILRVIKTEIYNTKFWIQLKKSDILILFPSENKLLYARYPKFGTGIVEPDRNMEETNIANGIYQVVCITCPKIYKPLDPSLLARKECFEFLISQNLLH